MKLFVPIFSTALALFSSSAMAFEKFENTNFTEFVKNAPCGDEVRKSTSEVFFRQNWYPVLISRPYKPVTNGITFRNTLTHVAFELFSDANSTTLVETKLSGEVIANTVWATRLACRPQFPPVTQKAVAASLTTQDANAFSNKELFDLLAKSKQEKTWGIIYIWSPQMPLSVDAMSEIKSVVPASNLTILMDGKASVRDANKAVADGQVQTAHTKRAQSRELFLRGMGLHYPIAFMYKNGLLSSRTYIGHKSAAVYQRWIELETQSLDESLAALASQGSN